MTYEEIETEIAEAQKKLNAALLKAGKCGFSAEVESYDNGYYSEYVYTTIRLTMKKTVW